MTSKQSGRRYLVRKHLDEIKADYAGQSKTGCTNRLPGAWQPLLRNGASR